METAVSVKANTPAITGGGNGHGKFPANFIFYLKHEKAPLERMEIAEKIIRLLSAAYTESQYKLINAKWADGLIIGKYAKKIVHLAKNGQRFFVWGLLHEALQWKKSGNAEENAKKLYLLLEKGVWETAESEDKKACLSKVGMFAF
ncbi:hypothetical protein COV61_03355, partial [Candidatus Micrarchaeota archaeon CG11_big_fil_rev_8_21_14_0_20_47_5]